MGGERTGQNRLMDLDGCFQHVVYEHRHFSAAAAASRSWALSRSTRFNSEANEFVPDCWVAVRTSLLVHARNLVDFYCRGRSDGSAGKPQKEDVLLEDFGYLPAESDLSTIAPSIAVHVLHITAWRGLEYRTANSESERGAARDRIEWDEATNPIIDGVDRLLAYAADPGPRVTIADPVWPAAFATLRVACQERIEGATHDWPAQLHREGLPELLAELRSPR